MKVRRPHCVLVLVTAVLLVAANAPANAQRTHERANRVTTRPPLALLGDETPTFEGALAALRHCRRIVVQVSVVDDQGDITISTALTATLVSGLARLLPGSAIEADVNSRAQVSVLVFPGLVSNPEYAVSSGAHIVPGVVGRDITRLSFGGNVPGKSGDDVIARIIEQLAAGDAQRRAK